jgi:hypothetical protein
MMRGKLIRFLVIPLCAVLVFWWGGYLYFKGSSDWQEVQLLLSADPAIRAEVGDIKEISVAPFPFMYRFSGDYVRATLRVTVVGSSGEHHATIEVERRGGTWSFVS